MHIPASGVVKVINFTMTTLQIGCGNLHQGSFERTQLLDSEHRSSDMIDFAWQVDLTPVL